MNASGVALSEGIASSAMERLEPEPGQGRVSIAVYLRMSSGCVAATRNVVGPTDVLGP